MSLRALRQYIELYHLNGIADFFTKSKEFKLDVMAVKLSDRKVAYSVRQSGNSNDLNSLRQKCLNCTDCSLRKTRVKMVFGEGNQKAKVMVISDPPNSDENMQGRPFMGEAGIVFNNMMKNVLNHERNDVYMTNIVKCRCIIRGANNYRVEYYDINEMKKCLSYLHQQIDAIKPRFILVMGEIAASVLFDKREGIDYFRSNQGALYKEIPVFVTYNPSELVGNIDLKRLAFVDLQGFLAEL